MGRDGGTGSIHHDRNEMAAVQPQANGALGLPLGPESGIGQTHAIRGGRAVSSHPGTAVPFRPQLPRLQSQHASYINRRRRRHRRPELHCARPGQSPQPDSSVRRALPTPSSLSPGWDLPIDVYSKHALATAWAPAGPLTLAASAATSLSSPKSRAASSPPALKPRSNVRTRGWSRLLVLQG